MASLGRADLAVGFVSLGRHDRAEVDQFDGTAVWRAGKIDRRFGYLHSAKADFVAVTCRTTGSNLAGYALRNGVQSAVTVQPGGLIRRIKASGSDLVFDSVVDGGTGYLLAIAHSPSPLKSFMVHVSLRN